MLLGRIFSGWIHSCLLYIQIIVLGTSLCVTVAKAEPQTSDVSKSNAPMNTSVVENAMDLIRKHEFDQARELLLSAAEKGDIESKALLGQMYNAGWGVPVDYKQAFKWWSEAAQGSSTDAEWGLGTLYDGGNGVPQDSAKAAAYWKQAEEHGNIKATVSLAFLYEDGRGVETDLKESAKLFKIAAEAGEPGAQLNYGLKRLYGIGVEQNTLLGCAWIGIAAESPRIKGTAYAEKTRIQKEKSWATLSNTDLEQVEKLKKEIKENLKLD